MTEEGQSIGPEGPGIDQPWDRGWWDQMRALEHMEDPALERAMVQYGGDEDRAMLLRTIRSLLQSNREAAERIGRAMAVCQQLATLRSEWSDFVHMQGSKSEPWRPPKFVREALRSTFGELALIEDLMLQIEEAGQKSIPGIIEAGEKPEPKPPNWRPRVYHSQRQKKRKKKKRRRE